MNLNHQTSIKQQNKQLQTTINQIKQAVNLNKINKTCKHQSTTQNQKSYRIIQPTRQTTNQITTLTINPTQIRNHQTKHQNQNNQTLPTKLRSNNIKPKHNQIGIIKKQSKYNTPEKQS